MVLSGGTNKCPKCLKADKGEVMLRSLTCVIISMALLPAISYASSNVQIGQIGYGGSGCPIGSVTLTPILNGEFSLAVEYDQFTLEAKLPILRPLRASCQIAVPVRLPKGISVAVVGGELRGFTKLSDRVQFTASNELFLSGQIGIKAKKIFNGEFDSNYVLKKRVSNTKLKWSACGGDVILRMNTSIVLNSSQSAQERPLDETVFANIDSQGIYQLAIKSCL